MEVQACKSRKPSTGTFNTNLNRRELESSLRTVGAAREPETHTLRRLVRGPTCSAHIHTKDITYIYLPRDENIYSRAVVAPS